MDVSIQIKRPKFAQNTIMIDCKTEIDNFFPFHTKKINLRVKSRRHIKNFKDFAEISIITITFALLTLVLRTVYVLCVYVLLYCCTVQLMWSKWICNKYLETPNKSDEYWTHSLCDIGQSRIISLESIPWKCNQSELAWVNLPDS